MEDPWRELLKYPNPKGLHPVEAAWRDRARELLEENARLREQLHLSTIDAANEMAQANDAEAKLANSEEECRWLEAQIRDLEAKLAKVIKAGDMLAECVTTEECYESRGPMESERQALLAFAAAKGEKP